jgi:hypothetical protein
MSGNHFFLLAEVKVNQNLLQKHYYALQVSVKSISLMPEKRIPDEKPPNLILQRLLV